MNRRTVYVAVTAAGAALVAATVSAPSSGASDTRRPVVPAAAKLGAWSAFTGKLVPQAGTPAVWLSSTHVATVLWRQQLTANTQTYYAATVSAKGSVGAAKNVFPGNPWSSLSQQPTLLGSGAKPTVVFDGGQPSGTYQDSCVYGAVQGAPAWTVQSWSLSNDCTNPVGGAAESKSGTLAADWANGPAVKYRIGISSSIPATGSDSQFSVSATPLATALANDTAGNGHFYAAYALAGSAAAKNDGYFVKDLTAGTKPLKMPGTGTTSVNTHLSAFQNLAVTSRSGKGGVYVAACSNGNTCHLELWKVGTKKALTVPGSSHPFSVAVSAGPAGRIWVAWYSDSGNTVSITRTNEAATKFGPVRKYGTPCFEFGDLGLSNGSFGRLDVAMECVDNKTSKEKGYATQVEVPLTVSASPKSVVATKAHTVSIHVTDVGDPVPGASVMFHGHKAKTNSQGVATFTVAKGTKAGTYPVKATAPNYLAASTKVTVTK